MKNTMGLLFTNAFLFFLISISYAQVPFLGGCPDVTTVPDFDAQRYLGKWYEAERYFAVFEFGGKCVTAHYSLNDKGSIGVFNQQISALTGMKSGIKGEANLIGRSDEAKLAVQFPSLPVNFKAPYWVIGTDYKSYAVVWSCLSFGIVSIRNAWILTREKHPSQETIQKAYDVLDNQGVSRAYFIRTDQKHCPKEN